MGGIGGIVFGIAGLLSLIAFLPWLAERVRLPYTVLLAALGCAVGIAVSVLGSYEADLPGGPLRDFVQQVRDAEVSSDVLLEVFLPLLLFEVALSLDGRALLDDLGAVLTLAVVAVLATVVVAGAAVWAVSGLTLVACLLVATIVAPTDPAAVVAIFREVGAPRRLVSLVEGESLLNDAAAIAVFAALLAVVRTGAPLVPGELALDILREFAGGALLGALLGRVAALGVGRIDQGGPAEVTLSLALAYLAYELGDHFLHVSGVVAVVMAGLVFGSIARTRINAREWQNVHAIWGQLGFWASSLIFVLASTLTPEAIAAARPRDLLYLLALTGGALAARAACLYLLLPLLSLRRPERRIDHRYRLVIVWGGLRGAVTLALMLAVSETPGVPAEVRHVALVLATGFVLFTLLVQGTTLRPLLRRLGLDRLDPLEASLRERAASVAEGQILKRLSEAAITYGIDLERADEAQVLYRRRIGREADTRMGGAEIARQQLVSALGTVTNREAELYVDELSRGMAARGTAALLVRQAGRLLDALKGGGVEGYRAEAARQSGFTVVMRLVSFLHRRLGLQRPLARRLAMRVELVLVRQHAFEELLGFTRTRLRALFGERIAASAEEILGARVEALEREVDVLRLQYPEYWQAVSGRYLSRIAVRLELDAYQRMTEERLLSPQVMRHLADELRDRLRGFEAIPPLDLGLDVPALVARVPLLEGLGPDAQRELGRLLVPRLALPGEAIVREGESGDSMFFIASGAVEVRLRDEPVRLGTGDFFGELALLTRRPRRADVVAIAYCKLLVLGRAAFRDFLRTHPEMMRRVRTVAAQRTRELAVEAEA